MLRVLKIRNFAIIDELELDFQEGFNVITGETGAGKSILLDAIGLVLGNRATADIIRTGAEEASVEALFDVTRHDALRKKLEALGLDAQAAESELLVKRTVQRNGKNKIFINSELVTLSQLGQICESMVDLCSQHEHQSLSKAPYQLDLVDRYGGLMDLRQEVREAFQQLQAARAELADLTGDERALNRTEDFLRFQIEELQAFDPQEGEEEALQQERRRLIHANGLLDSTNLALGWLGGMESSDATDALTLLGKAEQKLVKAAELDSGVQASMEALRGSRIQLQETIDQLSSYVSTLETNPVRLEEVEERLQQWMNIHRKYGASVAEILETKEKLERELSDYSNRLQRISDLEARIRETEAAFLELAHHLSKKRKSIAKILSSTIQDELSELMMPGTTFQVEFLVSEPNADGVDRVQFVFSPNPGEEPKPLAKIASGGELSRILLSIRRTIADRGGIGVYIFDEIDSGIGGQTASVVAMKLKSVSKYNQILCITHLPQVAAYGDAHYFVSKKSHGGRTTSQITTLGGPARVEELARMLGGLKPTDKSRAHAKDLLKEAARA